MINQFEYDSILDKCRQLPPARGMYLVKDYLTNLFLTVLDFQMHNVAVEKAIAYYKDNRWDEIRNLNDLGFLLSRYADDREGNAAVAEYLWGNRHWTRVSLLRKLVTYFESVEVTSQEALSRWAEASNFERDFKGKIPGMSYAIYQWLIMRQGIPTVKPDIHVRRFIQSIIKRSDFTDNELVDVLEKAANELGLRAYELDWRIWEYQKSGTGLAAP